MFKTKKTAILFFSRDAHAESLHKPFLGNDERKRNIELAELLINQTKNTLKYSGFDVIQVSQQQQIGSSFGEKLANAYQYVFNLGYDNVISVGNDTPELANVNWSDIEQLLNQNKVVLGPTQRGVYLIGIPKLAFKKEQFQQLNWQNKSIYVDLFDHFTRNRTKIASIAHYREVNRAYDLNWFIQKKDLHLQFVRLIIELLKSKKAAAFGIVFFILKITSLQIQKHRGPPANDLLIVFRKEIIRILSVKLFVQQFIERVKLKCIVSSNEYRGPPQNLNLLT